MTAIDPFVMRQAEVRASRLVRNYGFTPDDWDDLRQELLLDYLRRHPKFDPERGNHQGFACGVLRHHAAKLATANSRAGVACEQPDDQCEIRICTTSGIESEIDLRIDVEAVLSQLPEHLQRLAKQLAEMSPREVSRETGKSRSRIYQWIAELRRAFVAAVITPAILAGRGGAW